MSIRYHLPLPRTWISIAGLSLDDAGLHGAVYDEVAMRVVLFEGVPVITADATAWTLRDIIACLSAQDSPQTVEPVIARLSETDLKPLLACGALTRIDALRLMAHVPGWQP